jgi:hypothetical protein
MIRELSHDGKEQLIKQVPGKTLTTLNINPGASWSL